MNLNDDQFYAAIRPLFGKLTTDQILNFNKILNSSLRENLISAMTGSKPDKQSLSTKGAAFIAQWEGLKLRAYKDSGGIWTIGIGTIIYPNGSKVREGDTCTEAQAYEWFKAYIVGVEDLIAKSIKVPLTQNQFDALVSLIYNIGATQFIGGSVDDKINSGDIKAAIATWKQYRLVKGKAVQGLINRRNAETALFLS